MGSRLDSHIVAICIPADPARADDLSVNDASATGSDYTQASPRPGASVARDALSRLVPVVSGGQGADLELLTIRGGNPRLSLDQSVEVGYRFAGETDDQVRGWTPPSMLMSWNSPKYTAVNDFDRFDMVAVPSNQKLVCIYSKSADTAKGVAVFNPATWTWATNDTAIPSQLQAVHDCICVLPNDRLLAICSGTVYRSDDDGTTWELHARHRSASYYVAAYDRARMAASRSGGAILWMGNNNEEIVQLASDDGLGSLTVVYEQAVNFGDNINVQALPGGAFIMAYLRTADDFPCIRVLSSAWQSYADATEVVVTSNACTDLAMVTDPDGMIWVYATDATNLHEVELHVSVDGGLTFGEFSEGCMRVATTNADFLENFAACSFQGGVALAHNFTASTGNKDGSIGVAFLGGWSSLTDYAVGVGIDGDLTGRIGFGNSGGGLLQRCWLPIELPANTGLYASAGAGAATLGSGTLLVVTTAGQTRDFTAARGASVVQCSIWSVAVLTGGAVGTEDVAFKTRAANGIDDYAISVRHTPTGYRVYDINAAATLADVVTTATDFAISMNPDTTFVVAHREKGEPEWTAGWTGVAADLTNNSGAPAANGSTAWGHIAASAASSVWGPVRENDRSSLGGLQVAESDASALVEEVWQTVRGRPITHLPIPLPYEAGDTTRHAHLSVATGPGALGEVYDTPADYDFSVENISPILSPSPTGRWRSTSKAEQIIAWDFGQETWVGDSIALVVKDVNFATCVLEYYDGAVWQNAGTMGLANDFSTLGWGLVGDTMISHASGVDANRWLEEGELAGSMAIITKNAGADQTGRRILWNTAGLWGGSVINPTLRPRIILEVDGSEDAGAAATMFLSPKSGIMVVHLSALQRRRYWRVRIPTGLVTPRDVAYYEAGVIALMAVRALGAPPDWGWTREKAPNSSTRRSAFGTTRVKKLGPLLETWTLGWPSGVDFYNLRQARPDFLGSSVGQALVGAEDVPWLLGGLMELGESGGIPVAALDAMPDASGTTITDPERWFYGRMVSSVRQDHIVGKEGVDEVVRVPDLVVEGIV